MADAPRAKAWSERLLDGVAFIQANLLSVMGIVYALAGLFPRPGVAVKHLQVGQVAWFGERPVALSLTNLLLASMLFTAGLGVSLTDARAMLRQPKLLAVGVLANAVMPVLYLLLISGLAPLWPESDEAQSTLVGLALIGAMPIAGGASVWTQNADGNVPLTVGLVLASTLFSPISIPLALRAVSHLATGDYGDDLAEVAADGSLTFSLLSVVFPCLFGVVVRHVAGAERVGLAGPLIKGINLLVLLTLSYSNAAGALVQVIAQPDYDMLALVLALTSAMCLSSFFVGFRLARRMHVDLKDATSLTFAVGMNNSSASAVLATNRLADHPMVLLPILAYGMLQKVLAGAVDALLRRQREAEDG
jgi:BASS family bile acid:Na+ symporter